MKLGFEESQASYTNGSQSARACLKSHAVVNLFIVPKHFFVPEIIEERRPLAPTARRAGWIGSNILLSRVPDSGKIHIRTA